MQQLATLPAAQPEADSYFESVAEARIASEAFVVDEFAGLARAHAEAQAFVSLLAHELRSKLRVIEVSLQTNDDNGSRAALESTHSMQDLVEGLLELERGRDDGERGAAWRVPVVCHTRPFVRWRSRNVRLDERPRSCSV